MNSFGASYNPMMSLGGVTSLSSFGGLGMMPSMSTGMGMMDPTGMSMASMRCCQGSQMMDPSMMGMMNPAMGMMGTGMMGQNDALSQMLAMQQMFMMSMMQMLLGLLMGYQAGQGLASGGGLSGVGGYSPCSSGGSSGTGSTGSTSGGSTSSGTVSPGTSGMLEHANRMVGLDEDSDTAAIEEVTGKSGINPSTTPWCAAWAMNMLEMHGVLNLDGLSNRNYCPTVKSWGEKKGIWQEGGQYTPKAGDAILFDWDSDGSPDHIGIVERVADGKVYTIEGNSSDKVSKRSYSLSSGDIDGYLKT